MCVSQARLDLTKTEKIKEFVDWMVKVRDGILVGLNDALVEINIRPEFLILDFNDRIETIINSAYPDLTQNYFNDYLL